MDIFHWILFPDFWGQYLLDLDPDTAISTCVLSIYYIMYIGFCYCSEWIGILYKTLKSKLSQDRDKTMDIWQLTANYAQEVIILVI